MSNKIRVIKASPVLGDGLNSCYVDDPNDLHEAIAEWFAMNSIGEKATLELTEMTKEEFEAQPII